MPLTRMTALAMKLSLVTGQRISEVAGIELKEIDFNPSAPVWTVPGERTKNKKPNRVPLSPLALAVIAQARELAGTSEWVFPSPTGKGPMGAQAATKALGRARSAIGLEDFRIHDLRRTAATRMAELGISPHTISLILNHGSARKGNVTSKVCVQYSYDKEKREALEAWGRLLDSVVASLARARFGSTVPPNRPAPAESVGNKSHLLYLKGLTQQINLALIMMQKDVV